MAAIIYDPVPTSPGAHVNSVSFVIVAVDVAFITVLLMVCGYGGCCRVGGVSSWNAWLPTTVSLAARVFAVATGLTFLVAPRHLFHQDHYQDDGQTDVDYLTTNGSRGRIRRYGNTTFIRPRSAARAYPTIL